MKMLASVCGIVATLAIAGTAGGQEKQGSRRSAPAPTEAGVQENLDVYVGRLKHGSVEQRREAALALGRIGSRAKSAVPALTEALKCPDVQLRVEVAEALWQANKDPAAVVALVAALEDKDWTVVANAIEALARIGPGAKAAVPALLKALDESWQWEPMRIAWTTVPLSSGSAGCHLGMTPPPPGLRPAQVAWLLWRIDKHPAAMPALIKSKSHWQSFVYLGRIGPEAKAAVPVIAELLKAEDGWTRTHVAIALWRINKHPAAVPTLITGLKEKKPALRLDAIEALGNIGAEAKAAVPALAEALQDEKGYVARTAAEALGRIGPDAKAAVPALIEALKDREVRAAAALALWRINKHPAAVPALAESLKGATEVDYSTHYDLRRIGSEAKAALPVLVEGLKDKSVLRRVEVALTLWKIDENPAVVPVLVDALQDPNADGYVRMSAAKALWQINKHPGVVPALVGVLKDKNALLRPQAAEALWQINRHPAAVPGLLEALKDRDNWVSSAAARALGRIGAEATVAKDALTEAQEDEDEGVRTKQERKTATTPSAEGKAQKSDTPAPGDEDMQALQGTWRVVKGPGSPKTDEWPKDFKFVVKGNKMTMIDSNPDQKIAPVGIVKLDPKTKAFDWMMEKEGWIGIYELKGDDFKFYVVPRIEGAAEFPRPKSFDDKAAGVVRLFVLKREKPPPPAVPTELLKSRLEAAEGGYKLAEQLFVRGEKGGGVEAIALWSERVLEAKRPLCKNKQEEVAAAAQHADRMKDLETKVKKLVDLGASVTTLDVLAARHRRIEAEILLFQLKGK